MGNETKKSTATGHDGFERRDIGVPAVIYFLIALAVAVVLVFLLLRGFYDFLDKRERAEQPAVSPLVTNVPTDTRKLPPAYQTDAEGRDYEKYLHASFPAPQLEIDERTELTKDRLREEQTLATYGWVDEKAGTVHIPIDRAMDLIVAHGLPVVAQGTQPSAAANTKKGTKQ